MKKALKIVASVAVVLILVLVAFYVWAGARVQDLRARTFDAHTVDFPVPFPLGEAEAAELASLDGGDGAALARAIERGRHLIESRYACTECHGADFGGGTMLDDPAIGTLYGPNLTTGTGSVTRDFDATDWDRAVRHGIRPDGRPLLMPAQEFRQMSDQELSDILAYIRSLPPVDREMPELRVGPLGRVLLAIGMIPFAADEIPNHHASHALTPPPTEATPEFGAHLAGVCIGCHRANLSGGPIIGGDPSWPPAANLTPHPDGLADWTLEDFVRVLREGVKPDGTALRPPMDAITRFTANMSDVELQAFWAYLRTLPATPTAQ